MKHLETLAGITKNDSRVFYHLGNVYFRLNRIEDAINAYKCGLELSPNNPQLSEALRYLTEVQEP